MTTDLQDNRLQCKSCSAPITRQSKTGYCAPCALRARNADPEFQQRRVNAIKRVFAYRPELSEGNRAFITALNKSPERRAQQAIISKQNRTIAHARKGLTPEVHKRIGQTQSRRRLAHIPPEYRDLYRCLMKKRGIKASDATAIVMAQHEKDMADFRRKLGVA